MSAMPTLFRRAYLSFAFRGSRWSNRLWAFLLRRGLSLLIGERSEAGEEIVRHYLKHRRQQLVSVLIEDPEFAHRQMGFGQEGEDLILVRLLMGEAPAYYVDVGAHHPFRFSNTYLLYKAGWKGINIDGTPGLMDEFRKHRPNDINLELLVGESEEKTTMHIFSDPALNTASKRVASERDLSSGPYHKIGTLDIVTVPLRKIFRDHLPAGAAIGVLNIDVEGDEMNVLRSNDWQAYRPKFILVEELTTDLQACLTHEATLFLASVGYRPILKCYNTVFFLSAV